MIRYLLTANAAEVYKMLTLRASFMNMETRLSEKTWRKICCSENDSVSRPMQITQNLIEMYQE